MNKVELTQRTEVAMRENLDRETISLSINPEFLAILAGSRASLKAEGGIPLAEVKGRLGLA